MLNVIVAGGRDFNDYARLKKVCDYMLRNRSYSMVTIISGGANGADKLGERYAKEHGCNLVVVPANWNQFGKRAGHIRNSTMALLADAAIVFWDGKSRGSANMISKSEEYNFRLKVVRY